MKRTDCITPSLYRLGPVAEIERQRAQLNHDYLKNQLLLSLTRLKAITTGEILSEESGFAIIAGIQDTWMIAKQDAKFLIDALSNSSTNQILELPFVRHLDSVDRELIAALAVAEALARVSSESYSRLRQAVLYTDTAIRILGDEGRGKGMPDLLEINKAIQAVRDLSKSLTEMA